MHHIYYNIIDSNYLGPIICRPVTREISFCTRDGTPTRTQNCTSDESCSSSCRCFNGKDEQQGNTEEFTVNGIDGQGKYVCSTVRACTILYLMTVYVDQSTVLWY